MPSDATWNESRSRSAREDERRRKAGTIDRSAQRLKRRAFSADVKQTLQISGKNFDPDAAAMAEELAYAFVVDHTQAMSAVARLRDSPPTPAEAVWVVGGVPLYRSHLNKIFVQYEESKADRAAAATKCSIPSS
eukprot:TRINITY_DN11782_c0_g1_i1.p1 TRINITY_DN11782_c0_g1~~TRINITY_DN11782_c0_g1_i1.p1  ORF type:complete len:134 (-),score=23.79 TRINITY_DN11782_c0_g1_i1:2-403(-)